MPFPCPDRGASLLSQQHHLLSIHDLYTLLSYIHNIYYKSSTRAQTHQSPSRSQDLPKPLPTKNVFLNRFFLDRISIATTSACPAHIHTNSKPHILVRISSTTRTNLFRRRAAMYSFRHSMAAIRQATYTCATMLDRCRGR